MFKQLVLVALMTVASLSHGQLAASGGVLGISAANWEQGGAKGVEILQIFHDSSADLAGLHVGNVITAVNGKHIGSIHELSDALSHMDAGTRVNVDYLIKSNLGWMPKDTTLVLAKSEDASSASQAPSNTTAGRGTNAVPDPPALTTRTRDSRSNEGLLELPNDIGIFVRQNARLLEIEPEVVNWRTGGVIKTMATAGLDKGHINGTVPGSHSHTVITWTGFGAAGELEFYIYCPEGNSASEYQLLRLWDKGNRREFRSVTGGILHRSGGAQLNEVAFTFEKLAPRTYKIILSDLKPGEYGFLAPGAVASSNAASLGRIYSFRIPE